ncbi:MAG: succinate dehydrogenase/fumarate reductase iron-sulfur subunit [Desulfobacteraceae bacterium]|nr:succinate dehydrogenase/fumarate reductase iron-sulfur subunit [Desulfobacteraceae bacterium]MBU4053211.1 succinate dehydrogenase/fumarate reductase iron-sulfur subunit [Pseudomonadota bacterium]
MTALNEKTINITLKVWRQEGPKVKGRLETIPVAGISTHMSFLEMMDVVNEDLSKKGKVPIEFDHDCREGICGCCGAVVNGTAHGPEKGMTLCQLHMRKFKDGDMIVVEPWRSRAFPIIKDLIVDRGALDKIIQAGGYVSVNTGGAPDGNAIPIAQETAETAMDAAACIGCGACVAACPNASAMLFVSAKVSHLALLPQGKPEAAKRVIAMLKTMDTCGFGNCGNHRECEAVCPKQISISHIARLNREYMKAELFSEFK